MLDQIKVIWKSKTESGWPLIRTMKGGDLSWGVETVPRCYKLEAL